MRGVERKVVPVRKLLLDSNNPRHEQISDENDILAQLCVDEKVLNLAKHIATYGVSPIDNVAVVQTHSSPVVYTVVEGNRRVAALKLLRDPDRAPTARLKKTFHALKAAAVALPANLEVALFESRSAARVWMSVKHEGEQNGVGTRRWKTGQISRFKAQGGASADPNAQSVLLLDYAEEEGLVSDVERQKIAVTTVTRYLTNPAFRGTLGLVNRQDLKVRVDVDEFKQALSQFLQDALPRPGNEKPPVTSRSSSSEREDYAQRIRTIGVAPTTHLDEPVDAAGASSRKPASKGTRNARHPDARPHVVPTHFKIPFNDPTLGRLFWELRTIDPARSFACAYLIRAFVERLAHIYAKQFGLGHEGKLHTILGRCVDHLEEVGARDRDLAVLSEMARTRVSLISPESIGRWVHTSSIPVPSELKARWDAMEPGLTLLVNGISDADQH